MSKTLIELMSDEEFKDWMGEDCSEESISGQPLGDGGIPEESL